MDDDNGFVNPRVRDAKTLDDVIAVRFSRRQMLRGAVTAAGALGVAGCAPLAATAAGGATSRYRFEEIQRGSDTTLHVPEEYVADVLLRWGDALFPDSPAFDPRQQTAQSQARQFGYNCDFIGYLPLADESEGTPRGLLCVNHEYTSTALMFPGVAAGFPGSITAEHCAIEMAAQGGSVVEVYLDGDRWQVRRDSRYNRRLMAAGTPMHFSGPAAESPRLLFAGESSNPVASGTLNNCAGGMTPWGTYLMAEENFHGYFLGELAAGHPEAANHARYGVPGGWFQWGRFHPAFDLSQEPHGPNRFGWVVEVDVLDPASTPKKRTALGRFKHEGAESTLAKDGRLVIYMGDDERFEYVYKFVSSQAVSETDRDANRDLLDHGVLYVAKFEDSGRLQWLPLEFGHGPLTRENGFRSQADVLLETRRAADLLGATPMDRPEDIEAHPGTDRVYVMLTNNTTRGAQDLNTANPRPGNAYGHIIELTAADGDHGSESGRWDLLVLCGDPADPAVGATWNAATSANGWFGSPDNCAVDPAGRLWVATDGNPATGAADGIWALETEGPLRGTGQAFLRAPVGAEVCGPRFAPDGATLFASIQHPGDGARATFEAPTTRWPDFDPAMPPRPSVVAVRRRDGGRVGG